MGIMTEEAPCFWLFSLALYGQSGVEPSCLELQNNFSADVNILLWCGWLAWDHGHIVTLDEIDGADIGKVKALYLIPFNFRHHLF